MSDKPIKAEKTSTAASTSPRGSRKGDHRTLWLSRLSFSLSAVALLSVGYRSVARRMADDAGAPAVMAGPAEEQPRATGSARAGVETSGGGGVNGDMKPNLGAQELESERRVARGFDGESEVEEGSSSFVPRVQAKIQKGLAALRIKRLVVTQAVEDREPVDVDEVVDSETPVIAFVEVTSGAAEDQQVVVSFEHEGGHSAGGLNLSVPGNKPRWRTWGRTYNIKQGGRWTAVVRDSRGEELGRTEFTVRRQS